MAENYIWGFGALTLLVLLVYFLAIFGGVKEKHKSRQRN